MTYIYFFGNAKADGKADMVNTLGGKGAHLAEMTNLGLPVPPGFTIATDVCHRFLTQEHQFPEGLRTDVIAALKQTGGATGGRSFGDPNRPLLLSIRSGARISMPGMMDTILNLGLNERTVEGLAQQNGPRFAYDCYRRFIQMYADVVKGLETYHMENALDNLKIQKGYYEDTELNAEDQKRLCAEYKEIYHQEVCQPFPEDVMEQLWEAIQAVFKSWNTRRAKKYRKIHNIPEDWGTAANIQTMVFGNMGETSGTGVCFTRNPSDGSDELFGEYLENAQGEDVVSGIRTPQPISKLQESHPEVFEQLRGVCKSLEEHYQDMQDIEFTVQERKLYLLQTRAGKRTAKAAIAIAISLANEGLISKSKVLERIEPEKLEKILHPTLDPRAHKMVIANGLPASPGAVTGRVVFDTKAAEAVTQKGEPSILVRMETSPEDITGIHISTGLLTARGGMTSHAAVVARQMGTCCVVGCPELQVKKDEKRMELGGHTIKEGDWITLDGVSGEVLLGKVHTQPAEISENFNQFIKWAREIGNIKVAAQAESVREAELSKSFGAHGIGLCRTEQLFFTPENLLDIRKILFKSDVLVETDILQKLLEMQEEFFISLLKTMDNQSVVVRLLDLPIKDILPDAGEIEDLAQKLNLPVEAVERRVAKIRDHPTLSTLHGARLAIHHPKIFQVQVYALVQAKFKLLKEGFNPKPRVLVPLISMYQEMKWIREYLHKIVDEKWKELTKASGCEESAPSIPVGCTVEVPMTALSANCVAESADFFVYRLGNLTRRLLAMKRNDSSCIMKSYTDRGVIKESPLIKFDENGVGHLMKYSISQGRAANPKLEAAVCGDFIGDYQTIKFFQKIGVNKICCSPHRLPVILLLCAKAAIEENNHGKAKG